MARLISALLVLVLSTTAFAQTKAPTTAPAKAGDLPAVNFNGVAFKDAIDYIADISGANMVVNWKALEQANVLPDTQVTLKVGGVSVRKALELLLRQAGGSETPLTYTVEDGVVEITTLAAADTKLVTRTYGIQDLLFEAQDFTNAPQLSLTGSGSGGGGSGGRGSGGGGGGSNTLFGGGTGQNTGTGANATGMTQKERADEIIKMITTTIRPEIWQENGGTSKISFYRGNLIITAPLSVHRLIG